MSPAVLLTFIIVYFGLLLTIAYFTSRKSSDNSTFSWPTEMLNGIWLPLG